MKSLIRLNPAQQIVKIVDEELTAILGSETAEIIKSPKDSNHHHDGRSSRGW